jgi:hypothetical protein
MWKIETHPTSASDFCLKDIDNTRRTRYTQKKIFRNSSAAEDVVTEEYFEKFFCCTKISFARARIHSLQINIFGLERISTLPEEYLRQ